VSRQRPTSCLVAAGVLGALLGWGSPALGAKDDSGARPRVHRHAGGSGEAEAPKPAEPAREDENPAAGYVPGYRRTTSVGLSPSRPSSPPLCPAPSPPRSARRRPARPGGSTSTATCRVASGPASARGATRSSTSTRPRCTVIRRWLVPRMAGSITPTAFPAPGLSSTSSMATRASRPPSSGGLEHQRVDADRRILPGPCPARRGRRLLDLHARPLAGGLKLITGAYQDRYGAMAQYSEGSYGVSLIGASPASGPRPRWSCLSKVIGRSGERRASRVS